MGWVWYIRPDLVPLGISNALRTCWDLQRAGKGKRQRYSCIFQPLHLAKSFRTNVVTRPALPSSTILKTEAAILLDSIGPFSSVATQCGARMSLNFGNLKATFCFLRTSSHAGMMLFSNHGHSKGWRRMHGFGCHTFKWCVWTIPVAYALYLRSGCGKAQFVDTGNLWQTIEKGELVSWTAKARVMKPEEAGRVKLGFDPFDVIGICPGMGFPMQDFGRLVLNKNPENYHRDVEQSAFSPGSMVPGIEDSPDMLLQFRMVFYRDAQYHRIGINFHNVPVNCPFRSRSNASMSFGGPFRSDGNISGNPHYAPNSFVNKFRPDTAEAPY
ncbi:unnamed protein product [Tuber melanosporum]|uniref:(Perigord truffle) hypothetical protein n=1 Tax=Tuber melanosporum (strain Mel28) TaxID=656061 RepID=D5GLA3_TUBMM|nr:uncharacterized protein GSTUM_00010099001 [Tuber melanosporum]CAZ85296.1 unnamed protein product [Tuber melanosporum]